jgi:hypothetical protein
MTLGTVEIAYMAALALVGAFAVWRDHEPMTRTALALVLNWLLIGLFVMVSDTDDPWLWMMAMDFGTALLILKRPVSFVQGLLGVSYLLQITIHTGYALALLLRHPVGDAYWAVKTLYLDTLGWIAWGQVAALFCWAGGHGRRIRDFLHLRRRRGDAAAADQKGAAK